MSSVAKNSLTDFNLPQLKELALMYWRAGFRIKGAPACPESIYAALLRGRTLKIPPDVAVEEISMQEGRLMLSAHVLLNLITQAGGKYTILEATEEAGEIRFEREGHSPVTVRWDTERARQAKLINKEMWQKYPGEMRLARCKVTGARALFSDVLYGGGYTPEDFDITDEAEGFVSLDLTQEVIGNRGASAASLKSVPTTETVKTTSEPVKVAEAGPTDTQKLKAVEDTVSDKTHTPAVAEPPQAATPGLLHFYLIQHGTSRDAADFLEAAKPLVSQILGEIGASQGEYDAIRNRVGFTSLGTINVQQMEALLETLAAIKAIKSILGYSKISDAAALEMLRRRGASSFYELMPDKLMDMLDRAGQQLTPFDLQRIGLEYVSRWTFQNKNP